MGEDEGGGEMNSTYICPVCKHLRNEEILLEEKHDLLICPRCQTSLQDTNKSPLGRYKEMWNNSADELYPLLRPELDQSFLGSSGISYVYLDCYYTLLIGRYNASIVLMGVLLEIIMKERINLKLGGYFKGPYGRCLQKIEKEKLMGQKDIEFLRIFKDKIRNPYQHADDAQILQNVKVPVWPMKFEEKISLEKMEKAIKDVKGKKIKPVLLPAAEIPALRSIVKQSFDRRMAIELFNQVYDFIINCQVKYFKQTEYDEHNKKFGTGLENVKHHIVK